MAVDIGPDAFALTPAPLPVIGPLMSPISLPEGWTFGKTTADETGTFMYAVGYDSTGQGRPPRLFGYYIQPYFVYSGQLGLSLPLEFAEGPASVEGLFVAPSETGDLYGYGTTAKGQFTYFRFTLEQAEAEDIGAEAFPFPLDSAYDPAHDIRYSVGPPPGSPAHPPFNTLYVTDGHTGQTANLGTLSQGLGVAIPALAYQPSSGFLYSASWDSEGFEPLMRINPATLEVTEVGQSGAPSVGALCWNPKTGALYGVEVDSDGPAIELGVINTQAGQYPTLVMEFDYQWDFCSPSFDAGGRYLYVVGYQNGEVGSERPPHLLIFDLEAPLGPYNTGEPVILAPLLSPGEANRPSISDLFFAPPKQGVGH